MPRVIFVYAADPEFRGGGADLRVAALAEAAGEVAEVDVLRLPDDLEEHPGRSTLAARLVAAGHGVPPRLSGNYRRRLQPAVSRRIAAADLVVVSTLFSAPYVPQISRRVVLDAHNVETEVLRQLATGHPSPARRLIHRSTLRWMQRWEGGYAGAIDRVWAVSNDDAGWFSDRGASVVVVPNGMPDLAPVQLSDVPTVAFVGSLSGLFNREGVLWFAQQVWPLVRAELPEARFLVAGRGDADVAGPAIDRLGFVPDVREVYARARAVVVPLRRGGGTRLKQLEAMAHGIPVVATSIGAAGLAGLQPGRDYLAADDPAAFAEAVVHVLTNPGLAQRLRAAGLRASRGYTWHATTRPAVNDLRSLLNGA